MEETETRLDFDALAPRFSAAMSRLDAVAGQGLDPRLRELVRLHASTINGCAYCVDMHSKDAGAGGGAEQGLSNQTSFLRPIVSGTIHAVARRRHRGRTTWVWEVELSDDDARLCALVRMTIAVREAT